jgi:hypothetical protein
MENTADLLQSYEKDFVQHVDRLQKLTDGPIEQASTLDQTFSDCQKLLKQIEVEGINFMTDDHIRQRVRIPHA